LVSAGSSPSPASRWAVFSPLDLAGVDAANFIGYVLWSIWLVAFGVVILVHDRRETRHDVSAVVAA
jgi:hypothetical protein